MTGDATTPDLVELGREAFQAVNRRHFDAVMSLYAPGAVWMAMGLGVNFNGVGFAVIRHRGGPVGGDGYVQMQEALVTLWTDGLIERAAGYLDVDEARAAAERLAEERR
jgi:hypothetical protein